MAQPIPTISFFDNDTSGSSFFEALSGNAAPQGGSGAEFFASSTVVTRTPLTVIKEEVTISSQVVAPAVEQEPPPPSPRDVSKIFSGFESGPSFFDTLSSQPHQDFLSHPQPQAHQPQHNQHAHQPQHSQHTHQPHTHAQPVHQVHSTPSINASTSHSTAPASLFAPAAATPADTHYHNSTDSLFSASAFPQEDPSALFFESLSLNPQTDAPQQSFPATSIPTAAPTHAAPHQGAYPHYQPAPTGNYYNSCKVSYCLGHSTAVPQHPPSAAHLSAPPSHIPLRHSTEGLMPPPAQGHQHQYQGQQNRPPLDGPFIRSSFEHTGAFSAAQPPHVTVSCEKQCVLF